MPEVLKLKDGANWVSVGEEVAIGTTQPTKGQEIWIDTSAQSNAGMPTGAVVPFAAANAPAGWLICDGSAVSRTTYADLFSVIGTIYGTGDGSTTFTLPNLKGRVAVGRDASQTEFDAQGETGGAKTHTLTTAEMPAHQHSGFFVDITGIGYVRTNVAGGDGGRVLTTDLGATPYAGLKVGSTGSGAAHNNLQPYIVLTYIIKT